MNDALGIQNSTIDVPLKRFNTHDATYFDLKWSLSGYWRWSLRPYIRRTLALVTRFGAQLFVMRLLHLASALSSVSLALAWTTYVVPHSEGNDDTPALAAAFAADPKLATNATILFKQDIAYNIWTPIVFPRFENVIVSVQGNLTYAADIQATQGGRVV